MLRAFFAIPIDDLAATRLLGDIENLRRQLETDIRWLDRGLWHVTVKFFANISAESLGIVAETADHIARSTRSFNLNVKRIATFPNRRANILAAHLASQQKLRAMHVELNRAGEKMGIQAENRRFRPHITLARHVSATQSMLEPIIYTDFALPVTELVLYESKPRAASSDYVPLQRFNLLE